MCETVGREREREQFRRRNKERWNEDDLGGGYSRRSEDSGGEIVAEEEVTRSVKMW